MTDEKNPYLEMPEDVFKTHLGQIKTVIDDKKLDVSQFFGEPITDSDKEKIKQVDTLQTKVDELAEKANSDKLTDNETKLAQSNIDRLVSDIKKIDKDAPLEDVLKSKFNNLDKLDILNGTQKVVAHYTAQIETIRNEIPSQGAAGTQTFAKPATPDESSKIITDLVAEMIPKDK